MRHGFLLIDKPLGPTSHDCTAAVRRQLHERSVGHLGTLDPQASGLIVLAVGSKALKVVELFRNLSKEYVASITFGAVSTTYDAAGVIEEQPRKSGWEPPDLPTLRTILHDRFTGKIRQVPPAHSAVHVGGTRAYELARKGQEVALPEREVEIQRCEILSYEYPHLELFVRVSSGTYIRSLAHDLGAVLRCGGYLSGLRRTRVGEWRLEDAVALDAVHWTDVIPLRDILEQHPRRELSSAEWEHIRHGRSIDAAAEGEVIAWYEDLPVALLISLEQEGRQLLRARKVF